MNSNLEDILEKCLLHLATGEMSLEECLTRYPDHAAELRRLLPLTEALGEGRQVRPSAEFKQLNRRKLLAEITPPAPQTTSARLQITWADWWSRFFTSVYRPAFALVLITLLCLTAATTVAQAALPGDMLYSWKLGSERVWRVAHPDPLLADLRLSQRRANELTQVTDRPVAETVGREAYQQALEKLDQYNDPESQRLIFQTISEQQGILEEAGVYVLQLDQFIHRLRQEETPTEIKPIPEIQRTPAPTETPEERLSTPAVDPATVTPGRTEEIVPTERLPVLPLETAAAVTLPPVATPTVDRLPSLLATPTNRPSQP